MDAREEFIRIVRDNIERDGIDTLLDWLDHTDFYTAPASIKYHGAHEKGLVIHSLNVYAQLNRLCRWYSCSASNESIAIVALFHDLCKIGCYKTEMRWRKDENNQWEQYPSYKYEEDFPYGGHGSKSVFLVHNFIELRPDEAAAINCHMGAWDMSTYNNPSPVYNVNRLAWLLHVADEAATYLEE